MHEDRLDPELATALAGLYDAGWLPVSRSDAVSARRNYRALAELRRGAETPVAAVEDTVVDGPDAPVAVRVYSPTGPRGVTVVWLHGGGWVVGDLETADAAARRVTEHLGATVVSVDYRLAPEHPFPAAHDDALAATRWAVAQAEALNFDPLRMAVGGDSAGGALAASVALDLRGSTPGLAFQLLLYPVTQWRSETKSARRFGEGYFLTRKERTFFREALFGGVDRTGDPRLEVLHAETLAGAPPALVVTAGFDPLKDDGAAYAQALEAAGVRAKHRDFPGMIHGFYNMGGLSPAALAAIDETAEALALALG